MKKKKTTIKMVKQYDGSYGVPKYYAGGDYYAQMGNFAGNTLNGVTTQNNGMQDPWASGLGNGLKFAGTGAGIGTAIMPGIGTAIGAGLGFIGGGLAGIFGAKKRNKGIAEGEAQQQSQVDAYQQSIKDQQAEAERLNRLSYSNSYNAANPIYGVQGQGLYGYGGKMKLLAAGGTLTDDKPATTLATTAPAQPATVATQQNKTMPTSFTFDDYYKTLNGYQSIKALDGNDAPDVKYYERQYVVPALKGYQNTLNQALRAKYNLAPDAPITDQYLSPQEANKALNGSYSDYLQYLGAYQAYRQKTPDMPARNLSGTLNPAQEVYGTRHVNLFAPYSAPAPQATPQPSGTPAAVPQKAYGGRLVKQEIGGTLQNIAGDVQKAVGDTHEEDTNRDGMTGITLRANGKPVAEVEDQEVLKGNKVFSDRLMVSKGQTFAAEAERLAKGLKPYEENLNSTNMHKRNTAKRKTSIINQDVNALFNAQEQFKQTIGIGSPVNEIPQKKLGGYVKYAYGGPGDPEFNFYNEAAQQTAQDNAMNGVPVNNTGFNFIPPNNYQPQATINPMVQTLPTNQGGGSGGMAPQAGSNGFSWGNTGNGLYNTLATAAPYLVNAANMGLINKTPQVPVPTALVANNLTAAPLKTNYNINPALNDIQSQYRQFNKSVDDNTANSATGRANKLAGFASAIDQKSKLYGQKENIETELINKNNLNQQQVADRNLQNSQNVGNQNRVRLDEYRNKEMLREDDMRTQRSQNLAANLGAFTKQVQDRNMYGVDQDRILLDSLRYSDAAGISKMIGTSAMDNLLSSNPDNYYTIEKQLKNSGQSAALKDFYAKYKAPK